jgi:hypothetical protein
VRAQRSTTCASGWSAASTACASTRSTSAFTTRSCATTRRVRRTSAAPRLQVPTILTVTNGTSYNNTQPEMLPFLEEIAQLIDEFPDAWRSARSLGRFHRDRGRVHAARAAAHGLQLRAAQQ